MVEKYLWTMHGCKPLPPTEEECNLERQRLVGHCSSTFPCHLVTSPAFSSVFHLLYLCVEAPCPATLQQPSDSIYHTPRGLPRRSGSVRWPQQSWQSRRSRPSRPCNRCQVCSRMPVRASLPTPVAASVHHEHAQDCTTGHRCGMPCPPSSHSSLPPSAGGRRYVSPEATGSSNID